MTPTRFQVVSALLNVVLMLMSAGWGWEWELTNGSICNFHLWKCVYGGRHGLSWLPGSLTSKLHLYSQFIGSRRSNRLSPPLYILFGSPGNPQNNAFLKDLSYHLWFDIENTDALDDLKLLADFCEKTIKCHSDALHSTQKCQELHVEPMFSFPLALISEGLCLNFR